MLYIDTHITDFDLQEALAGVSPQRREQALRYRNELDQRLSVAAYRLLCRALATEYGITEQPLLAWREGGKPYLPHHPQVHFSISHCKEVVACAVADVPVGVDVERMRPFNESLARYVLSDEELQQVMKLPAPDVAFIRLWTVKESLLKLTGEGIRSDLKTVLQHHQASFHTVVGGGGTFVCTQALPLWVERGVAQGAAGV